MRKLYTVSDWSKGLVTNVDQGELPPESCVRLENIRNDQPGKITGVPGYKAFTTALPTAIQGDGRHFQEVVINDTQVMICWGVDGSDIQHIYYSTDSGANWVEMTEVHFDTLDGATTSPDTDFSINTGNANIDDHWICQVSGDSDWDYVTAYNSGTKAVTTKYGVGTASDDEDIVFCRFPLFPATGLFNSPDNTRNIVRDPDNFKPTIIQRDNAVSIYTGRDRETNVNTIDSINLWFGYIDRNFFDDSDLDYDGYACEIKELYEPSFSLISSVSAQDEATDGLDYGSGTLYYAVILSFLYDGYQESPIYWDNDNLIGNSYAQGIIVTKMLRVSLSYDLMCTREEIEQRDVMSRRMSAVRVYVCQVEEVVSGTSWRPTTPLFFVKEVDIDDGSWSGSGPYTIDIDVRGRDWDAGQRFESELVQGYFSHIRNSADFATVVKGREVCASIRLETLGATGPSESKSQLIYSAINSAGRNTQDAFPRTDIKDMQEHGIYEIMALQPLGDKLVVFGNNHVSMLDDTEELYSYRQKGIQHYWSTASRGEKIGWANQESIYELVEGGIPNEIGFPIRDTWQALSTTNRNRAVALYDEEKRLFIVHSPSGTTYIYDEALKSWRTYVADKSWEWLSIGVDGEVLATDKTNIYQLFATSSPTENPTGVYEKIIDFGQEVYVKLFEILYKLTGNILIKIYDIKQGENYTIAEKRIFSQSNLKPVTTRMSFKAENIKIQLTITPAAAANYNWEIDRFSFYGEPLREER